MRSIEFDAGEDARTTFMRESQSELEEIRQRERFKWFAERLESRVDRHAVEELAGKLVGPLDWPGQCEKAVVLLALKGTIPALRTLEDLDTSEASNSFRALYGVCLEEARARVLKGGVAES